MERYKYPEKKAIKHADWVQNKSINKYIDGRVLLVLFLFVFKMEVMQEPMENGGNKDAHCNQQH